MNLLNLPPWKQEEILFLESGAGVTERAARSIAATFWPWRSSKTLTPQS